MWVDCSKRWRSPRECAGGYAPKTQLDGNKQYGWGHKWGIPNQSGGVDHSNEPCCVSWPYDSYKFNQIKDDDGECNIKTTDYGLVTKDDANRGSGSSGIGEIMTEAECKAFSESDFSAYVPLTNGVTPTTRLHSYSVITSTTDQPSGCLVGKNLDGLPIRGAIIKFNPDTSGSSDCGMQMQNDYAGQNDCIRKDVPASDDTNVYTTQETCVTAGECSDNAYTSKATCETPVCNDDTIIEEDLCVDTYDDDEDGETAEINRVWAAPGTWTHSHDWSAYDAGYQQANIVKTFEPTCPMDYNGYMVWNSDPMWDGPSKSQCVEMCRNNKNDCAGVYYREVYCNEKNG